MRSLDPADRTPALSTIEESPDTGQRDPCGIGTSGMTPSGTLVLSLIRDQGVDLRPATRCVSSLRATRVPEGGGLPSVSPGILPLMGDSVIKLPP